MSFPQRSLLLRHKLKFHGEASPFVCDHPDCFESFQSKRTLRQHIKKAHPELNCTICDKVCIGHEALDTHMLTHSTDGNNSPLWRCESCTGSVQFVHKYELMRHYQDFHDESEIPPYLFGLGERPMEDPSQQIREPQSLQTMMRDQKLRSEVMNGAFDIDNGEEADKMVDSDLVSLQKGDGAKKADINEQENKSIISLVSGANKKVYHCPRPRYLEKNTRGRGRGRGREEKEEKEKEKEKEPEQEQEQECSIICNSENDQNEVDRFSDISDIENIDDLFTKTSEAAVTSSEFTTPEETEIKESAVASKISFV
ncbi:hypothetical protein JCM33374_g762 [Metschnikowia sp. JCM 33374]|nr:hypothetical protein JCM33374_g762 [Metschnikowia sp. JCM 33374]